MKKLKRKDAAFKMGKHGIKEGRMEDPRQGRKEGQKEE